MKITFQIKDITATGPDRGDGGFPGKCTLQGDVGSAELTFQGIVWKAEGTDAAEIIIANNFGFRTGELIVVDFGHL